jgi:hypothetical protein
MKLINKPTASKYYKKFKLIISDLVHGVVTQYYEGKLLFHLSLLMYIKMETTSVSIILL